MCNTQRDGSCPNGPKVWLLQDSWTDGCLLLLSWQFGLWWEAYNMGMGIHTCTHGRSTPIGHTHTDQFCEQQLACAFQRDTRPHEAFVEKRWAFCFWCKGPRWLMCNCDKSFMPLNTAVAVGLYHMYMFNMTQHRKDHQSESRFMYTNWDSQPVSSPVKHQHLHLSFLVSHAYLGEIFAAS